MKIVIAEDNYVSRLLLKKVLIKTGHEVLEAEDGKKAWELFQEHKPDIIISDWMMPEMDGLELCRRIRSSKSMNYSYIMFLTAMDKQDDLVEVFNAGADDYIAKPFSPDELKSRIKTGERVINLEKQHRRLQIELLKKNKKLEQAFNDLAKSQAQVAQSEKMASIGQLAAGVAHEINNPIGFVSSNLTTLKEYMQDFNDLMGHYKSMIQTIKKEALQESSEKLKKDLEQVEDFENEIDIEYVREDISDLLSDCIGGTQRVSKIVADLKDFAHPGNDNLVLMDINAGIDSTLNVVANEIKYKAEVIKDYGDIPNVEGFPQQLNQVIMNMLVNAAQAIETRGEIKITTRQADKNIEISISDTGSGIPKENLSKIFDPFFTTKEVGKGTGLGMNIAYNIIKKHKGTIKVQSELNKGTTFTIILPAK